jgi:hypothetical protein
MTSWAVIYVSCRSNEHFSGDVLRTGSITNSGYVYIIVPDAERSIIYQFITSDASSTLDIHKLGKIHVSPTSFS